MAQGKYFFTSHVQHTTAILASLDVIFSLVLIMSIICLDSFVDFVLSAGSSAPPAMVEVFKQVLMAPVGTGVGHGLLVLNLALNVALLFGVLKPYRFFMLPWMIMKAIAAIPFAIIVICVLVILPTAVCQIFGGGAFLLPFILHIYQLVTAGKAFSELRPGNMQQSQGIMI